MTKAITTTDWNGSRSSAKPTITPRIPTIRDRIRAPVSMSWPNARMIEKIPAMNSSEREQDRAITTIVAPGQTIAARPIDQAQDGKGEDEPP